MIGSGCIGDNLHVGLVDLPVIDRECADRVDKYNCFLDFGVGGGHFGIGRLGNLLRSSRIIYLAAAIFLYVSLVATADVSVTVDLSAAAGVSTTVDFSTTLFLSLVVHMSTTVGVSAAKIVLVASCLSTKGLSRRSNVVQPFHLSALYGWAL